MAGWVHFQEKIYIEAGFKNIRALPKAGIRIFCFSRISGLPHPEKTVKKQRPCSITHSLPATIIFSVATPRHPVSPYSLSA
jgi:hypothetical protein